LRPLSDTIEQFIKELMAQEEAEVELKRNELAEYFRCTPSQINYVLATRFTPNHGYIIESRRGGGGYIRVMRIRLEDGESLVRLVQESVGEAVSEGQAAAIISRLLDQGVVTPGEAKLMRAATAQAAVALPVNMKDALRAMTLRSMLLALAHRTAAAGNT
jgi:transcriptional regulator CtsR